MSTKQNEIDFKIQKINLQSAVYNHLMNINSALRKSRHSLTREQLNDIKAKRRDSDKLLSEVKNIQILDYFSLMQCENKYKQF